MIPLKEQLGSQLREARESKGLSLTNAATVAGLSKSYLSEVERGIKDVSSDTLTDILISYSLDIEVKLVYPEGVKPAKTVYRESDTLRDRMLAMIDGNRRTYEEGNRRN